MNAGGVFHNKGFIGTDYITGWRILSRTLGGRQNLRFPFRVAIILYFVKERLA